MLNWRAPTVATIIAASALIAPPLAAQAPPTAPAAAPPAAPQAADDATPAAYLEQARLAVTRGNIFAAEDALEHAETRILARSVRPSQAREPSQQALVQKTAQAREALAKGDRTRALELIGEALQAAAADPG